MGNIQRRTSNVGALPRRRYGAAGAGGKDGEVGGGFAGLTLPAAGIHKITIHDSRLATHRGWGTIQHLSGIRHWRDEAGAPGTGAWSERLTRFSRPDTLHEDERIQNTNSLSSMGRQSLDAANKQPLIGYEKLFIDYTYTPEKNRRTTSIRRRHWPGFERGKANHGRGPNRSFPDLRMATGHGRRAGADNRH